ncbi:uncharacterized protein METZ01_LOCUS58159, partial [marine metagenome]
VVAKRFSDQTLQAVAINGSGRDFSRHRNTQPGPIKIVTNSENGKQPIVATTALGNCCSVLLWTKQSQTTGEPGVIHKRNFRMGRCCLGAELRAPLGSTGADHGPTAARFHSRPKAMPTFTLDFAGLKGSLHLMSSLFCCGWTQKGVGL